MIEELPKDDLFKDIPLIDLQEKLFECKKMAENKWIDQALIGSAVHDWIGGYLKNNMAEQGYYKGHDERANHIRKLQYPMYEYLNKNIEKFMQPSNLFMIILFYLMQENLMLG